MVFKLEIKDESSKKKILKRVAGFQGVAAVWVNMKEKKITVIGDVDPYFLTSKLRKFGFTELLSVSPAKEEKKEDEKHYIPTRLDYRPFEYGVASEEKLNACVIL